MLFRRSFFTLIEMMIVLIIVSVVGGVVAISVNTAINQQRFRTEVSTILDQLRLAQDLMLTMGDVHLKFEEERESKAIVFWLDFDFPLAPEWEKELKRKHKNLKAIHRVDFKDKGQTPQTRGILDLQFLSGGSVMSQGTLIVSTASTHETESTLTRYICLPGYPTPFLQSNISEEANCSQEINDDSNEQMTRWTRDEIAIYEPPKNEEEKQTPNEIQKGNNVQESKP